MNIIFKTESNGSHLVTINWHIYVCVCKYVRMCVNVSMYHKTLVLNELEKDQTLWGLTQAQQAKASQSQNIVNVIICGFKLTKQAYGNTQGGWRRGLVVRSTGCSFFLRSWDQFLAPTWWLTVYVMQCPFLMHRSKCTRNTHIHKILNKNHTAGVLGEKTSVRTKQWLYSHTSCQGTLALALVLPPDTWPQ